MEITKRFKFEAAHFLPGHETCGNMHGHSYKLYVTIEGDSLDKMGMLIDFGDLKNIVKDNVISKLDHKVLNEVFTFSHPTAERMVKWVWDSLSDKILSRGNGISLKKVTLYETENNCATYYGK